MGTRSGRNPEDDDNRARASSAKPDDELAYVRLLERAIGKDSPSFFEVGDALREIREQHLYRMLGYATFADYIERRLATSRGYVYRKMSAARIVAILRAAGVERLPANEAQARELASLIDDQAALCAVWLSVIAEDEPRDVTAAKIRSAVARSTRSQ